MSAAMPRADISSDQCGRSSPGQWSVICSCLPSQMMRSRTGTLGDHGTKSSRKDNEHKRDEVRGIAAPRRYEAEINDDPAANLERLHRKVYGDGHVPAGKRAGSDRRTAGSCVVAVRVPEEP
jgi:hypothetical protein